MRSGCSKDDQLEDVVLDVPAPRGVLAQDEGLRVAEGSGAVVDLERVKVRCANLVLSAPERTKSCPVTRITIAPVGVG